MGPRSHDAGTFGAAEWEPRLTRWVGGRLRHLCGLRAPRLCSAGLARRVDGSAPRRQAWLRDHPLRPGARPAPRVRLTLPARAVPDREAGGRGGPRPAPPRAPPPPRGDGPGRPAPPTRAPPPPPPP